MLGPGNVEAALFRSPRRVDVTLAVLSDSTIQSQDGKLSIIGLFQEIRSAALPVAHAQCSLVVTLRASPAEAGEHKRLTVRLMDEDSVMMELNGEFDLPKPYPILGRPVFINQVFTIQGLVLPKAGDYAFHVLVGGEEKAVVPFSAVLLKPPSS